MGPSSGLQAIILCGPGEGLNPFNSNPKDFPKALIPIANRPMIWYPLEWCHRAAITNVTLITPPECVQALETALSQNPYLTSLPSTLKATILAPADLELTTGTAEIFRLPEVQNAIAGDFVVLPCDIVCELSGRALWETWMTPQRSASDGLRNFSGGSDAGKGGLGVWYETNDKTENGVGEKKEETDFLATTALPADLTSPCPAPSSSLGRRVRSVRMAIPTHTLRDEIAEKEHLRVRSRLLIKYGSIKMQVKTRDAHIYFMPYWAKEFVRLNETFESFGEDVIGWWAKAGWQKGLVGKLRIDEAMRAPKRRKSSSGAPMIAEHLDADLAALSSTAVANLKLEEGDEANDNIEFASRVPEMNGSVNAHQPKAPLDVPPLLGYVHPALQVPPDGSGSQPGQTPKQKQSTKGGQQQPTQPISEPPTLLVRRIDTVKLLLSCSLYLARLPNILQNLPELPSANTHPYCHSTQVHATSSLPGQATIATQSVLIDANCVLQPRITIRDSVIAANCSIASGSRLHGCLLMEGVVVEEKVTLNGCVLGRGCKVEKNSELKDCFLQEGYVVTEGTTAKGEVLAGFDEGADSDENQTNEGDQSDDLFD